MTWTLLVVSARGHLAFSADPTTLAQRHQLWNSKHFPSEFGKEQLVI